MKIQIQKQSDKVSPVRLKIGRHTASMPNVKDAKRIKQFITKVWKDQHAGD